MTEEEKERWESVIRTSRTMEAIREIQRRSELDKDGKLIKDNLKGAIPQKTETGMPESSDEERTRQKKVPGRGHQDKRKYAPTGEDRVLSKPRVVYRRTRDSQLGDGERRNRDNKRREKWEKHRRNRDHNSKNRKRTKRQRPPRDECRRGLAHT